MQANRCHPLAILMTLLMGMSNVLNAAHFHDHDDFDTTHQIECVACSSIEAAANDKPAITQSPKALTWKLSPIQVRFAQTNYRLLPQSRAPPTPKRLTSIN